MSAYLPLDQRFLGLDDDQARSDQARVVVVPAPFEKTSSYGLGSDHGPAAILEASQQVELFDTGLGFEPWKVAGGIATLAPLDVDGLDGAGFADRLEGVAKSLLDQDKTVVTLAGEHTAVVGAIRAHARAFPGLTIFQLDAHSDLRPSYLGEPWSHACAMARVLDFTAELVQVGIRSETQEERAQAESRSIPVFRGEPILLKDASGEDWITPIVNSCGPEVYVTLDCDVFDPAVIPATGTPEPGGLNWIQIDRLFEALCRERRVVGFDICELAPIPELVHPQFTLAKLAYRLIGRGMAQTRQRARRE